MTRDGDPVRCRRRWSPRLWWGAFALLLVVSLLVRVVELDVDPPLDASRDLSLTVDGSWYVGTALDWATDREPGLGDSYDPPIFGAVARGAFRAFGPTMWTANLISVLFGVVAIGLTALAVRCAYGDVAGLLGGILLSVSYPFFSHGRAPGVYVPLSALSALLLLLYVSGYGRRHTLTVVSWCVVGAGVIGLKSAFALSGVALLLANGLPEWWHKRPQRLKVIAVGVPALIVLAGVAWTSERVTGILYAQYDKLATYLNTGGGLESIPARVVLLEDRVGLLALEPILVLVAVVGTLFAPPKRVDRLAVSTLVVYFGLLAVLGYSPFRYSLPAFPALAFLAARALTLLVGERAPVQEVSRHLRMHCFRGAMLSYLGLQICLAVCGEDRPGLFGLALGSVAVGVTAELTCGARSLPRAQRFRIALAALCILVFVTTNVFRGSVAIASAQRSIRHANVGLTQIIHPDAHIIGPFAHALSYETQHRRSFSPALLFGKGRLARSFVDDGVTHFVVHINEDTRSTLEVFARDGAPVEFVHEFYVRCQKVHVYRFPWARDFVPLTPFEEGVLALQQGDRQRARRLFERLLEEQPSSAPAASALGAILLEDGDVEDATVALERALEGNPTALSALRNLLTIRLRLGDLHRALDLARRVVALDPSDEQAARLVGEIEPATARNE